MAFGVIIVGDEILSGRRTDKHLAKVIELLAARGLKLAWARYVGDESERLVATLRDSFSSGDLVFCFGGIGATPDDRTRQSAAIALARELRLHPQAEAMLRAKFGADINAHRLEMGVFPDGAEIIPNPYNQIPGFSIRNHYFVPGFPVMAWPMIEWVLDSRFAALHHAQDYVEASLVILDGMEGALVDLMEAITNEFPDLALFSLPTVPERPGDRQRLELGVKGSAAVVARAMARIRAEIATRGYEWVELG